jgi:hypothetical protein
MEILKSATTWAKAEMISSIFFMLFGVVYLSASIGFWQLGKTPLLKALIFPTLIAGGLLLSAGVSFYFTSKSKLNSFENAYKTNPSAIIKSEITRTEKTIKTYENIALKVFPLIVVVVLLVAIFISYPLVRAICIGIIAFLLVLILLDSQALKRMKIYHEQLEIVGEGLKNK